jgi:hypothetical protein
LSVNQKFSKPVQKLNNINFLLNLWLQKKLRPLMYFSPPLFSCWIRDPGWKNLCLVSGIKYVGSATLVVGMASPPIPRCLTQPLGSNVLKVEQLKKYASSEKLNYDSLCYRFRIKIFTFKKLYVSICNLSYFSTFISLKIYLRWVK